MRSKGAWRGDRRGFAVRTNRQGTVCKSSPGTLLLEWTYSKCAAFLCERAAGSSEAVRYVASRQCIPSPPIQLAVAVRRMAAAPQFEEECDADRAALVAQRERPTWLHRAVIRPRFAPQSVVLPTPASPVTTSARADGVVSASHRPTSRNSAPRPKMRSLMTRRKGP